MSKNVIHESDQTPHNVIIKDRNTIEMTCVMEICTFDETHVMLKTGRGNVRKSGKSLRVTTLSPSENKAIIQGSIDSLVYTGSARGKRGHFAGLFS